VLNKCQIEIEYKFKLPPGQIPITQDKALGLDQGRVQEQQEQLAVHSNQAGDNMVAVEVDYHSCSNFAVNLDFKNAMVNNWSIFKQLF
jgi:hypothetical protein